ncbi:MAG: CPBP family intramembrane metalloprotease [Candidatus Heimdallarchaeota archaeon]|nr:CPBP family intramembrane metalloprotease [Candidatus Heimdallarchaeota archaeon]
MLQLPNHKYEPTKYYLRTIILTWILGFASAYLSYEKATEGIALLLIVLGIFIPMFVSLMMFSRSGNPELKKDFKKRLFSLKGLSNPQVLTITVVTLPLSFFLAVLLSIAFGGDQSQLAMSASFISAMLIPFIASIFEEVGWRGYGVDSLRSQNNLFMTSIKHWIFWSLWHLPLFFVNGFYHHELWVESPWLAINYFLSILPLTIVFNWIYFKTERSVLIAIFYHLFANASAEIFAISEASKVYQTLTFSIIAILLIMKEKKFFFDQKIIPQLKAKDNSPNEAY